MRVGAGEISALLKTDFRKPEIFDACVKEHDDQPGGVRSHDALLQVFVFERIFSVIHLFTSRLVLIGPCQEKSWLIYDDWELRVARAVSMAENF